MAITTTNNSTTDQNNSIKNETISEKEKKSNVEITENEEKLLETIEKSKNDLEAFLSSEDFNLDEYWKAVITHLNKTISSLSEILEKWGSEEFVEEVEKSKEFFQKKKKELEEKVWEVKDEDASSLAADVSGHYVDRIVKTDMNDFDRDDY